MDAVALKLSKFGGLSAMRRARDLCLHLGARCASRTPGDRTSPRPAALHLGAATRPSNLMNVCDLSGYVAPRLDENGCPRAKLAASPRLKARPRRHARHGRLGGPVAVFDYIGDKTMLTQSDWISRANAVLPGGGFGNFDPGIIIREGKGSRVWDEDGKEYVDLLIGSGPMLLGHGHPEVVEAVLEQLPKGMTFFANNTAGIELAEEICNAVPVPSRCAMSALGSEADMYAMRLARAFTGREKILKFEGGYHGMSAEAQMSLAPTRLVNFPLAVPDSPGIPQAVRDAMLVAPFNDIDVRAFHHRRACPRDRRHHRRAVPAHPAAGTRFPPGVARGMRQARHRAGVRRDRHRFPLHLWRRAGLLRRGAGRVHAGQDHRRRLCAGGHCGPGRHHGALRQGQGGCGRLPDAAWHAVGRPSRRWLV
jgi:hypothetical protein